MGLLFLLASLVRLITAKLTFIISRDGTRFITMAYYIRSENWNAFVGEQYHPLYPLLIFISHKIIPDWITSAKAVSVVMGALCVIPLYYMALWLFNRTTAKICAVLFAFHPYAARFSGDVISDTTYLFFFLSALALGYLSFPHKRKNLLRVLTGITAGLAYLTRPEGMGIIIVLAPFIMFYKYGNPQQDKIAKRSIAMVLIIFSFTVTAFSYIYLLKQQTGEWRLTTKKKISDFVPQFIIKTINAPDAGAQDNETPATIGPYRIPEPAGETGETVKKSEDKKLPLADLADNFFQTFHVMLFLFAIAGIYSAYRQPFDKDRRLLSFIIASAVILNLFVLYKLASVHYLSKRHLLPATMLLIPFSANGIEYIAGLIRKKINLKYTVWAIVAITVIILAPKTFKPQRSDKLYIKDLAQWLKTHGNPSSVFLIDDPRITFYAGANFVIAPRMRFTQNQFTDFMANNHCGFALIGKEFINTYIEDGYMLKSQGKIKLTSIYKRSDNKYGLVEYYLFEYIP